MSKLILPGQQAPAQVNFSLVLHGDAILVQINGLQLPPLSAEHVLDLADKLEQAANAALKARIPIPVEISGDKSLLEGIGLKAVDG